MKPSIAVLLGTSGTGKGTRVVQMIKFLESKGYKTETLNFTNKNKQKQLGIKFPELNLAFIGVVTTSNKSGLASWTSMDYIHATLGGVDGVPTLLKPLFDQGLTLVCEGEPMMQSNRWRPQWINETYGVENFNFNIFTYGGNRGAYDARIIGRSGKEAGDSGWNRESQYANTHNKIQNELDAFGVGDSKNVLSLFDEPLWEWGVGMLEWIGQPDLVESFVEHAQSKPMLRDINGNNPLATTKKLW